MRCGQGIDNFQQRKLSVVVIPEYALHMCWIPSFRNLGLKLLNGIQGKDAELTWARLYTFINGWYGIRLENFINHTPVSCGI